MGRVGMPGVELERAPVRAPGAVQLAEIDEERAEVHVHVRARRAQRRGALEVAARLVEAFGLAQREAEVGVRGGEVGLGCDRALEAGERGGQVALALAHDAEVVPALGVVRVDREPLVEALLGVFEIPPAQVDHALLDQRLGIVRPELQDAPELQNRLVQVAGLVVAEAQPHARLAEERVGAERSKVVVDCAGALAARQQEIADARRRQGESGVSWPERAQRPDGMVVVAVLGRGGKRGRRGGRRPWPGVAPRPGELVPQLLQHRRGRGVRDRPWSAPVRCRGPSLRPRSGSRCGSPRAPWRRARRAIPARTRSRGTRRSTVRRA